MAFFNEFPHTRTYDSDLGWLIKEMKKLLEQWGNVEEAWNKFLEQFGDSVSEAVLKQLQEWLEDGTLDTEVNKILNISNKYNVKLYGAIGDGVTDDSEAISEALNDLLEHGSGTLYFPDGSYLFDSITINKSAVAIAGESMSATILLPKHGITIAANSGLIYANSLCNLTLRCGEAQSPPITNAVTITNAGQALIENIRIMDFNTFNRGFLLTNDSQIMFNNVTVQNTYNNGIEIVTGNDIYMSNVRCDNCDQTGIFFYNSSGAILSNVTAYGNKSAIQLNTCDFIYADNIFADTANTYGLSISTCHFCSFNNTWVSQHKDTFDDVALLYMSNSDNINLNNLTVRNSKSQGMQIINSQNINILNGIFYNNAKTGLSVNNGTLYLANSRMFQNAKGITLGGEMGDSIITNNIYKDNTIPMENSSTGTIILENNIAA